MNVIVNADQEWGIGKDNQLLVHIPEDMKMFRKTTIGHVVVMGRKTLESFPHGKPLPKRRNIVLTRDTDYDGKGADVVHSKEELLEVLKAYDDDEIYVIGGESIYRMLLPLCHKAIVTRTHKTFVADTFFPNLDEQEEWKKIWESDEMHHEQLTYTFQTYEKN